MGKRFQGKEEMKMRCLYCKGILEDKTSIFTLELDGCIVIIKNVPAHVCSQCGEASFSDAIYRQLEKVINSLRGTITEVAIVNYSDKIA